MRGQQITWALLRISLGAVFLWAFFDKLLGLGFATCRVAETGVVTLFCERAWLYGGSPTIGFLKFGTHGPLASLYQGLAGSAVIDWLFMLGLLGIGLALVLGVLTRVAIWSGVAMMLLMYTAAMPPENNPVIDEHVIYALVLLLFLFLPVGEWWGLGRWWSRVTHSNPWLR